MPRIRYLKPEFWKDEDIAELSPIIRLFFMGLWNFADKSGRLEDRPKYLKKEIFPDQKADVEKFLITLTKVKTNSNRPFIQRYEENGEKYIQILSWYKHQKPHHTEAESKIPPAPPLSKDNGDGEGKKQSRELRNGEVTVKKPLNEKNKDIDTFFSYYLLKTKKAFKLTPDKKALIHQRLKDGYTLEQLKQAVDNFMLDDWKGREDRLDLIYCIGKQKDKPDNLEKWLNKKQDPFAKYYKKEP